MKSNKQTPVRDKETHFIKKNLSVLEVPPTAPQGIANGHTLHRPVKDRFRPEGVAGGQVRLVVISQRDALALASRAGGVNVVMLRQIFQLIHGVG